ncbi:MAG TPA: sensor histidine kinase [Lachnospiraceae bacterium]|nr:sensor histidine kinase [Lachnospiraceae bacterium]
MNGFVREWFDRNYVYHEWMAVADGQEGYYTASIQWSRVKELMFEIFLVGVVLLVLVIRLISVSYASYREKQVLRAAGKMINDFMRHDREASEVFPAEYVEVSLQMVEIKAAMQRQEQLQKEEAGRKNDLITYLAHDLKTPLTSVIGYLSLLDEAQEMPQAQKTKYIHITLDKAHRLEKLINEFFEITRYNLQQIILEKEMVDLHFMLIQLTDEFYPILSAHGNTIRLELQSGQGESGYEEISDLDESITVYGDGEKLARVFNNILKNAVAYSYPDTEILVRCIAAGDKVYITFSNRGKTIPAQKLNAIFEKFFRLDEARSSNNGGAGLGLAIAKDIVTLHGGRISADSADEVTTFTVELPVWGTQ